eukprot:tig00020553_g10559.t1
MRPRLHQTPAVLVCTALAAAVAGWILGRSPVVQLNAVRGLFAKVVGRRRGRSKPPPVGDARLWSEEDVVAWVLSRGSLAQFADAFRYTNGVALLALGQKDLEAMGVSHHGARQRLLAEIAALQSGPEQPPAAAPTDSEARSPSSRKVSVTRMASSSWQWGRRTWGRLAYRTAAPASASSSSRFPLHRSAPASSQPSIETARSLPADPAHRAPPLPPGYEYHAFITYRRKDGKNLLANLIKAELDKYGYRVFFDLQSLQGGTFDSKILESLRRSCCDVFVLTAGTLDRCFADKAPTAALSLDWVRKEIAEACRLKKAIVPFVDGPENQYPDCKGLPSDMAAFSRYNAIFFISRYQQAAIALLCKYIDDAVAGVTPFHELPAPLPEAEIAQPVPSHFPAHHAPPLPAGYEHHAFIAFRKAEGSAAIASFLDASLGTRGYKYSFCSENSGDESAMFRNLRASCVLVFIFDRDTLEACKSPEDWLRRQIADACNVGKAIVPVMDDPNLRIPSLSDVDLPPDMASALRHVSIFWEESRRDACLDQLCSYIDAATYSAKPFVALDIPPPLANAASALEKNPAKRQCSVQ